MTVKIKQHYGGISMNENAIRKLADSDERLNIRLLNDFAFKTTFHNKAALTGLLSALLDIDPADIRKLEFMDSFLPGEYADDKEGILDVKLLLNGDRKINIEIQVLPFANWEERSLFYLSKYFVEGFEKGTSYKMLEATVHISILAFPLYENGTWYSIIEFRDRNTHRLYSDKMSLRVLQLSQLSKATPEERKSEIYEWAQMISADDWEVLKNMAERNEYMKAAVEELEKINTEKEKRYHYLMREKWEHDEATIRDYERDQGVAQGKAESILELLEEFGEIPEQLRTVVLGQHDTDILRIWLKYAAKAESLDDFISFIQTR